jgi:hypothetical protein
MRRQLKLGILVFLITFIALTIGPLSRQPLILIQIDQPQRNTFACIYGHIPVGQSFLSKAQDLEAVDVFFGPILSENGEVIFHLRTAGQEIRTVIVNPSNLIYNQYNRFGFPKIPDSNNKRFDFEIESPNSTLSSPVCVSYFAEPPIPGPSVYEDGSAFMNGTQIRGDLTFRAYSETTLSEAFTALCNLASEDIPFFAAYLLLLAAMCTLLVKESSTWGRFLIKRTRRGNRRK